MIDKKRLVELIKKNQRLGFTLKEIRKSMVSAGWTDDLINEAMCKVDPTQCTSKPKEEIKNAPYSMENKEKPITQSPKADIPIIKILTIFAITILIAAIVWAGFLFFGQPATQDDFEQPIEASTICGDGIQDITETSATCCKDAGCPTGQSCEQNTCTTITEIPQPTAEDETENETENETDIELEPTYSEGKPCTKNNECDDGNPNTKDFCEFTIDYKAAYCKNTIDSDESCVEDSDCDDSNMMTTDVCRHVGDQGTTFCEFTEIIETTNSTATNTTS